MGNSNIVKPPNYTDYLSLKRDLENRHGTNKMRQLKVNINQTGTAGAVDLSEKAATTITQIGKTETNFKVKSSAADAGLLHAVITAHYLDQDGVQHEASIADASADLSGAGGTDFDTPVTDFYCWDIDGYGEDCFTSSIAVGAAKTLDAGVAGTGYAQIAATKTSGTKASYFGVGTIYGRHASNHADGDNYVAEMIFITPWGKIRENYTCTLGADQTDEIVFLSEDGFPIQDFYHIRKLIGNKLTTANTGAFLLTDSSCNNVNGSGADVWGGIAQGSLEANITKYFVPSDAEAYLARVKGQNGTANLTLVVTAQEADKDAAVPHTYYIPQSTFDFDILLKLEPLTFCSMTILGNTATLNAQVIYLEAADQNKDL